MAIQLRRGNKADLDTTQLKQGEPVVALDTKEFGFKGRENEMIWGVPANRTLAGISLEKDILMSELIAAGLARGASDGSGNALNALSLGGVDAGNYIRNTVSTQTLTLINGWAGVVNYFVFGKVALIRVGNTQLIGGAANTAAAVLPNMPIGTLTDVGNGIQIKEAGGAWFIVPVGASIAAWTFTVILLN